MRVRSVRRPLTSIGSVDDGRTMRLQRPRGWPETGTSWRVGGDRDEVVAVGDACPAGLRPGRGGASVTSCWTTVTRTSAVAGSRRTPRMSAPRASRGVEGYCCSMVTRTPVRLTSASALSTSWTRLVAPVTRTCVGVRLLRRRRRSPGAASRCGWRAPGRSSSPPAPGRRRRTAGETSTISTSSLPTTRAIDDLVGAVWRTPVRSTSARKSAVVRLLERRRRWR